MLEIAFVAGRLEADLLGENYKIALRGGVLVLLLGLVVWVALQRLVFRPVADLMQGIERVAAGETGAPVPVRSRDELGQVAAAFNRMTERLEEARQRVEAETDRSLELMRRLRQTESLAIAGKLCSSIAHEVGTPLNIIAGRAELMLRALPKDSPLREDLDVIITQIDRISRMIRAALDPFRQREPERAAIAPASVTEGLRPLLQHFARSRGVTLAVSIPRRPSGGARRSRAPPAGADQPAHERHRGDAGGRAGRGHRGAPGRRRSAGGRHRGAGHGIRDPGRRSSPDLRSLLQHQARSRRRRSRPLDLSGPRAVKRERDQRGEHARRGHHLHRLASRGRIGRQA